jgi:hypothetical protein
MIKKKLFNLNFVIVVVICGRGDGRVEGGERIFFLQ